MHGGIGALASAPCSLPFTVDRMINEMKVCCMVSMGEVIGKPGK